MQPSKSHQAALTPGYNCEVKHNQSLASGCFAFMRKRGKNISPQQCVTHSLCCLLILSTKPESSTAKVCTALPSPGQGWAAAALPLCAAWQKCGSEGCGSWALWKLKGGWESREVWPFDCCTCFCQYCAFADLVSFSTTNFPLCYFKLTCLVVLFD